MHDVLIIGGGVIGLSLAWDLARHGRSVQVIDQGEPGREASWAGAGILPAAVRRTDQHPYEQLYGLAGELHSDWARDLHAATGIDNGYRRCGGLYLARTPGETAALAAWAAALRDEGIEVQQLSADRLAGLEPKLAVAQQSGRSAAPCFHVPGEAQLRNPRHLQALSLACRAAGVTIASNTAASGAVITAGQVEAIETSAGPLRAGQYCFTAGAWTGQLLSQLGISVGIVPIRGQMVLFRCAEPPVRHIINEGSRYLVPRDDGRLLAGSTEEEVGFDKRTTDDAIAELTRFARSLIPALAGAEIEQTWAGLRPGSFDGLPYLGRLPGLPNAFIASGHFRSGLSLSPATAVVMSQLIRDEPTEIDLAPFRVGR
ncbi:MAG TPA: glycine oxidase ThiO [Pirellulaceae bacterium]|nr:glycine oxidase ThiO [Pirellulaceae bacterium]